MKADIKILGDTVSGYNNLANKLDAAKTGLKEAVSTLTANGWSGAAKMSYEQSFEYTIHCYEQFEKDFVERMKKVLEDAKTKAGALKNRCEDFENCILGNESGIYGEDCGGTSGILSLEYDNVTNMGGTTTDITFDLVQKELNKLRDISDTITKDGWFNDGLKYDTSFNIDSEVETCAREINKEKERITQFNESFGTYYNEIKQMEEMVKSNLKLLIDDVAKDVKRDYYTPLDYNSDNYDWDRIKGLMELDPDLISNDEYDELMKAYTKMANKGDTDSMQKFIESSYIYIGPQNSKRDVPLDSYEISPVYKEMSNRYKLMVDLMVVSVGVDNLNSNSEEAEKIRKYISNADILSSVVKHASVIDASTLEPDNKLDVSIKEEESDLIGNKYNITINGKIPDAEGKDDNTKITVHEISASQDINIDEATKEKLKSMKKDLADVIEDAGKDYVKSQVTDFMKDSIKDAAKGISTKAGAGIGVAEEVIEQLNEVNEKYTEEQKKAKEIDKSITTIDFANDAEALAISSSVSVSNNGNVEVESAYVDLDEAKYRIWYFENHGDKKNGNDAEGSPVQENEISMENYVKWYSIDQNKQRIVNSKNDAEIQKWYEDSEISKTKSVDELLEISKLKSNAVSYVSK